MIRLSKGNHKLLLLIILGSLLLGTLAIAGSEALPRSLVSSGGGPVGRPEASLRSALGQPLGGLVSNGLSLCSGFLCGTQGYRSYLPAVLRD